MTDKEKIKTAECCLQAETREDCYSLGCPCNSLNGCVLFNRTDGNSEFDVTYEIIKELLGVINRQQEQLEAAANGQETLQKALAEKDKEIERITAEKDQLIRTFGECQERAIKDFAKAVIDGIDEGYISHSSDIIDFTADYLSVKEEGKDY